MTQTDVHGASYDTALAIIGMAGRFPGARTAEAYWQNIAQGVKSIRLFSDEELTEAGIDPALLRQPNYVKAGTVIEDIENFDASFFGYTPREAEIMDPQHRLFMECAWEALEGAAYNPKTYAGLVGVFAGSAFSSYMSEHLYTNPDVVNMVGRLQIDLGNDRDSLASAVSYKLNLRGPAIAVQTFCSTSLVAVHLACQSLFTYECDMALAGGVAIALPQISGYLYEEGGILSPDGACRTFDAQGKGSVMGNGVGVVALKRLREALEDGDHIYAVIRGSAVNNDGSMHVSYTAPGLHGQKEVIAEALGHAGVDAESISYIEAHGTATMLGDAVELAAMIKSYEAKTQKKQFCALGSVKPNIGHLDRASGVAGLIKTSMALHHRQLPPSLNFERSSPDIDLDDSPFYVNTALCAWASDGAPRRAGVSSFGLGGTNAHVVLEEAPEREACGVSRPRQLLLLSACTETALQAMTANLAAHLKAHEEQSLADVASTLQVGRSIFQHRRFVVCANREEAIQALETIDPRRIHDMYQTYKDRAPVFLFPGVGEQYAGLARELYQEEAAFRETLDRCLRFLRTRFGLDLREALALESPPAQGVSSGRNVGTGGSLQALLRRGGQTPGTANEQLKQTAFAQPAVFIIEYALAQLLMEWGIRPEAMLGYSLGEYVAACLAGVLSLEDALALVTQRARLIQDLPAGAMVAVALSEAEVQPFLDGHVCLAAINGPNSCVLAGPVEAIEQLEKQLAKQLVALQRVPTTHAFHSTMLEALREPLTEMLRGIQLCAPQIPYISNITGTWITDEQATDPTYWAQHMCQTVRFADGAGVILQNPEWLLLEVGPGQSLGAFIRQHPACSHDRLHLVLSTLPSIYERQSDLAFLLATLGKLWLAGVTIDWAGFYAHERRLRVPLPTYPFERKRYWIEASKTQTRLTRQHSVPVSKGKQPDLADWFYLPSWEQTPLLASQTQPQADQGPYLVLADTCGLGDQLASRLEQAGATVVIVRQGARFEHIDDQLFFIQPGEKADYIALCKALQGVKLMPRTVLHCWQVTPEDAASAEPADFRACQDKGLYSVLFLTQAFAARIYEEPVQIVTFSNHMQVVTGEEVLQPEKATILGACKIVPQEHLNIACRSIDLSLAGASIHSRPYPINQLLTELTSTDQVVAYRGRTRWVQAYRNIPVKREEVVHAGLRRQGIYMITGGFGRVGMVLAEYLARTVQARLVLLGRSTLPERRCWPDWLANHDKHDYVSGIIRGVLAIEELGSEVLLITADVADSAQIESAIARTEARFGGLHGVIHGAGISEQAGYQTVQDIGREACELHFQPKVYGVLALERALQGRNLDFCILCSSISAVLGGLGFAGYAAANIYMDAFVQKHNASAAVPWISVNWDTWQVKENVHGVLGNTVAEYVMTPEEGTEIFARAITCGVNQLVISTGNLESRLDQWIRRDAVNTPGNSADAAISSSDATRPNLSTPYVPAGTEYEQKIVDIWQQVLGIGPIGIHDNFFELGGHSLIGTQLISRLRYAFQINLPLATLFEAPTVAELTLAMKMKFIEEIDRLDEEEVQRLV